LNIVRASVLGAATVLVIGVAVYAAKYQEWVTIPKAREPLFSYLKDPASAQFRKERITPAGALCGEVNSKNSMGGYVGFKRFILAGSEANYIEGGGPIGEWSTPDFLIRLKEETAILKRFNGYRKDFPDIPIPTDSERYELTVKRFFDVKWEELCEPSKK